MIDDRKQKLMALGLEALADLLLDLASSIERVDDKLNQLVDPASAIVKRFRQKIAALENMTGYINDAHIFSFAIPLGQMLTDMKASVLDPSVGLELVAEFFETDNSVFENSDDDGIIGGVYVGDAKDLFFHYASLCKDKEKVVSLFLQVALKDDYGARSSLMDRLPDHFDKEVLATMLKKLQVLEAKAKNEKKKSIYTYARKSIKAQILEAELFADALQGKQVELSNKRILEVVQVLLYRDEVDAAHAWIKKITTDTYSDTYEIEKLLKQIYAKQGDRESLIALYYKNFKSYRTFDHFQELLEVAGEDKRAEILANELTLMSQDTSFSPDNAKFLADMGMFDELEEYLFTRIGMLGDDYYTLPDVAKALAEHTHYLAACLIYRSLLDSMMERAYAKSYHHGIDYLHAMDKMAPLIKDWKSFATHNAYKVKLLQANKRKTSFWNQYVKK